MSIDAFFLYAIAAEDKLKKLYLQKEIEAINDVLVSSGR